MDEKELKKLLTPSQTAITGTKFPKDIHYRKSKALSARFTLCMPDGFICSVPVFEGEDAEQKIRDFIDNWYKVTRNDPEKFDHFTIKEKCPKCGGELRAKIHERSCSIWCINHPNCNYQVIGDDDKARNLIYEKHGIKVTYTHKTGACVIFSNKSQKKQ